MTIEKQVYHSGPFKDVFAQCVKVGNILYLAGQVGIDKTGTPGVDITAQTQLAYANIQRVLEKFDADMSNIVDETMFVTDVNEVMSNSDTVFGARAEAYGEVPKVTNTLVQVSALLDPRLKLEIKCIAHV